MYRLLFISLFTFFTCDIRAQIDSAGRIVCLFPSAPQFPGGQDSLKSYINKNLKWPGPYWCGQGTVIVRFKVNCKGQISDEKVVKGIDSLSNNEALRIVKQMPKWVPQTCDTWPEDTWYNLPVKFK